MCSVMREAPLDDHGILLEYQLPLSSRRLDCMITGKDRTRRANAVVVELKQWESVFPSAVDDCVTAFVEDCSAMCCHPSRQVGQYQEYLEDCHSAFAPGGVRLASCAYLHNLRYASDGELYNSRHADLLTRYPLFAGDRAEDLSQYLSNRLAAGDGASVLTTVLESKYQASKRLLDHTAAMIKGQRVFVLLDEQLVVFNAVLGQVTKCFNDKQKAVILVRGRPRDRQERHRAQPCRRALWQGLQYPPRHGLEGVHGKHAKDRGLARQRSVQVLQQLHDRGARTLSTRSSWTKHIV